MAKPMQQRLAADMRKCATLYARHVGQSLVTISRKAAGNWNFFDRLDDPDVTFTVRIYDQVMTWLSTNWPDQLDWPPEIERPPKKRELAIGNKPRAAAGKS